METLIAIPFITAIVSAFKMAGLPSKYAPVASIIIGIFLVSVTSDIWWTDEILIGVVLGLSASGLYSGGKTVLTK